VPGDRGGFDHGRGRDGVVVDRERSHGRNRRGGGDGNRRQSAEK